MKQRTIHPGLGNKTPQWKLDFIAENAMQYSVRQIAEAIGVSDAFVYDYTTLKGIPRKEVIKRGYMYIPIPKRIYTLPQLPEPNEKITRPPARYDNKTTEERIDELLNL